MAALLARPRRCANHRLTSTPTIDTDEPALPAAYTSPYSANTCQRDAANAISPMPTAPVSAVTPITARRLYRSTRRPSSGMVSAETQKKVVAASESDERDQPRSSVMGLSSSPNAIREPLFTKSAANPAQSITQP